MTTRQLSFCAQELRRLDHDRYLAGLFAPAARREDLFALFAFNLELARTPERVQEPMLGRIRLQWWRETLDAIVAGKEVAHEVARPLAAAMRGGLRRDELDRLIDAREFDLEGAPPPTLAALEAYAEATSATLLRAALQVLAVRDDAQRSAAEHAGMAYALVGLVRAVPFHARQRRLYLPEDLRKAADLRTGELFELRGSEALRRVAAQIAARADEHLVAARRAGAGAPAAARPALLHATLAARALARLRRAGHDPFAAAVQRRDPGRAWALTWASVAGKY
jgi:phytoene synthase